VGGGGEEGQLEATMKRRSRLLGFHTQYSSKHLSIVECGGVVASASADTRTSAQADTHVSRPVKKMRQHLRSECRPCLLDGSATRAVDQLQ
jgi:hypothetical protein